MLGNVYEWCHDWYAKYPNGPQADPTGPRAIQDRGGRGGSYEFFAGSVRAANRYDLFPSDDLDPYGFRLARSAR